MQGRFEAFPEIGRLRFRPDADLVDHADDAGKLADLTLGFGLLEVCVDHAVQGHDAVIHLHIDSAGREVQVPADDLERTFGDFVIAALLVLRQPHLDLLSDRLDATHAARRALGRQLLLKAGDMPRQRDDTILGGDADMRGVDARLEFELSENIVLDRLVRNHMRLRRVRLLGIQKRRHRR